MEPTITPTGATLGAIVRDVDLADLDPRSWKVIEAAFHRHAVLVFPGQGLSSQEQVDFAKHFGEIELLTPNEKLEAVPISNVRADGSFVGDDEEITQILRGNEGWHTDSSYLPVSARASVLSAHVVPPEGGETEWADMRAAWEALDEETRERIEGLSAYHSLRYSQAKIGHTPKDDLLSGFRTESAPLRPLVKVHPVTGRTALMIGRHAHGIPGLAPDESEQLLGSLLSSACRPPRTFLHGWEVGDVAVWDNRAVLHRARPYDPRQPRSFVHVRVAGDPRTEGAAGVAPPGSP